MAQSSRAAHQLSQSNSQTNQENRVPNVQINHGKTFRETPF